MKFFEDFRNFAMRGNVVDMAVGIIVGASFGKIVTSLVTDVIMPPIGIITGDVDFSRLAWVLKPPAGQTPEVAVRYGMFINTIVDFLIVAFSIFVIVQVLTYLRRKKETPAASPVPTREEQLLTEIRDLLKEQTTGFRQA